jgi:type II secretory ATPase GspE/PulE/Tfp pilus assembly ATPase PilB-like protein
MGIEPFLLASTVLGVVAQRLGRTRCPHCRTTAPAPLTAMAKFGLPKVDKRPPLLSSAAGCARCRNRGMVGRTAVYELMPMSDSLRDLTLRGAPAPALRAQAVSEGMTSMRSAAINKVLSGETTLEEVARVLFLEGEECAEELQLKAA